VRGDSIYAVSLQYKKTTVQFRDSYLLLKASLADLTRDFETSVVKGVFPHDFMNCERLEYTGPKPGIEFYKDITAEDYDAIPPVINLRDECLKYLEGDCVSLHQAIVKFQILAIEHTGGLDPLHSYTIASYANKA